jgi:hypothetical protein
MRERLELYQPVTGYLLGIFQSGIHAGPDQGQLDVFPMAIFW